MNVVSSNFRNMFLDFVLYTCFYFIVRFSMLYQLHVQTFFIQINLIKDLMLQTLDVLCSWVQECMIPLSYSVIMLLINCVRHKARNHT